jgi:hypothetical protein
LNITELPVKQEIDAVNVVPEDNPVPLVLLVMTVVPESQVLQVLMANLAKHLHNPVLNKHHHHANLVLLAHQAHLVLLVLLVMLDQTAILAVVVAPQLPVNLDQKDLLDLPDLMDNLVHPEIQDLMLKVKESFLDHLDPLVMLDHLAPLDLLDNLEAMAPLDNPDPKVPLAQLETPEAMDSLVLLDKLDLPVVLEKRVSAPNIVPSTVVSSSKTELADKHFHILCSGVASDAFFSFNCNAHCHCCHTLWLCKPLDRLQLNCIFVILLYAKLLVKNKKHTY